MYFEIGQWVVVLCDITGDYTNRRGQVVAIQRAQERPALVQYTVDFGGDRSLFAGCELMAALS